MKDSPQIPEVKKKMSYSLFHLLKTLGLVYLHLGDGWHRFKLFFRLLKQKSKEILGRDVNMFHQMHINIYIGALYKSLFHVSTDKHIGRSSKLWKVWCAKIIYIAKKLIENVQSYCMKRRSWQQCWNSWQRLLLSQTPLLLLVRNTKELKIFLFTLVCSVFIFYLTNLLIILF